MWEFNCDGHNLVATFQYSIRLKTMANTREKQNDEKSRNQTNDRNKLFVRNNIVESFIFSEDSSPYNISLIIALDSTGANLFLHILPKWWIHQVLLDSAHTYFGHHGPNNGGNGVMPQKNRRTDHTYSLKANHHHEFSSAQSRPPQAASASAAWPLPHHHFHLNDCQRQIRVWGNVLSRFALIVEECGWVWFGRHLLLRDGNEKKRSLCWYASPKICSTCWRCSNPNTYAICPNMYIRLE